MTTVYLYTGEYGHGEESRPLVMECARLFLAEKEAAAVTREALRAGEPEIRTAEGGIEIAVAEGGKPYFCYPDGRPVEDLHFSVSNSGSLWVCAVSEEPCGIDVQIIEDRDWQRIAERTFSPEELLVLNREGEAGFYRVWTRKEAQAKLTGRGFFGGLLPVADSGGRLTDSIVIDGRTAHLTELSDALPDDVFCSLCMFDEGPVGPVRLTG